MSHVGEPRVLEREATISAADATIRGTLKRPGGPAPWSSSRTAAAAAGSARATSTSRRSCRTPAWGRSCSTCWKRRGQRPLQGLRHRAPGRSAPGRGRLAGGPARDRGAPPGLFRRQHRGRRGAAGGGPGAGIRRRGRLARRPARPGRRRLATRDGAHPADRRRQRRDRPGAQPRGVRSAHLHPPARHRPRRHPPVPRARRPRGSRPAGPRVVPPLPDAIAHLTTGPNSIRVGVDDLAAGAGDQRLPIRRLMVFLMNRTEPSANATLKPPGCGEPAP